MRNLLLLLFLFGLQSLWSQTPINIALINDRLPDNQLEDQFEKNIKEEILVLLQHRYEVQFNSYYGNENGSNIPEEFEKAYTENDIIIGVGTESSSHAISLKDYSKPTIASIVLDVQLQGLKKAESGNSEINNFTYLQSPFSMKRDINLLYQIQPFEHLLVVSQKGRIVGEPFLQQLFSNYLEGKNITIENINYESDVVTRLSALGDKKVAAYALPYFGSDTLIVERLFENLNKNKIPSASLFGEEYLSKGALAGYQTASNLQKIPRRIALSVMKIVEGQNAAELSVEMQTFGENLVFNMETARLIGVYPNFDLMNQATLINLDNIQTDNTWTLHKAIAYALQSNLDIKIDEAEVGIAQTEVGIATSDLLPQIDASTSLSVNDEKTTFSYQGALGRTNWILSGDFSQVVFSEPLLANVAIKKILKESEETALLETQLDVIIDVSDAYMNILFAKSNLNIQQQNVERNKDNFNISKAKEAIGYSGKTDLYRWEAELANANINLNNAYSGLRQAKLLFNQRLNRPINEPVEIGKVTIEESMVLIADDRTRFIDNYGEVDQFADFLVQYAMKNLPELSQIDLGVKVQERLELSRQRAMYLPSLGVSGSVNRTLGRFDIPEGFPMVDKSTSWSVGLGVSYPIFQGNNRRKLIEQSRLSLLQLQDTKKNVENQLELRIRVNIENVAASYASVRLTKVAADASQKNFEIVKDAYSAGQSNITTLIDAQNNALATQLNANNAVFALILDFLTLERSIGYYNFLATPTERDSFFQQLQQYFNK
ncbi:MAG: outer membrane protein [Saprospiraceae bacterium]|jgi:outer membrane protein